MTWTRRPRRRQCDDAVTFLGSKWPVKTSRYFFQTSLSCIVQEEVWKKQGEIFAEQWDTIQVDENKVK